MLNMQKNKYLETAVQTASPAQLLIMLCDGSIRFSRAAIEALNDGNYEEANRNLLKVQDIVMEFALTVDENAEISVQLQQLYEYFIYLLREANIKKIVEPVEEVLGYLVELKSTWVEAALLMRQQENQTTIAREVHV